MQNRRLLNIINSVLVSLLLLVSGLSFLTMRENPHTPVQAEEYTVSPGVKHSLGKLNRFYSNINSGEFSYPSDTATEDEFLSFKTINGKYENPEFTMLKNADAKENAAIGQDGTAENIYFSFGAPQSEILDSTESELSFLINLQVSITRNGTYIYTNDVQEDSESIPQTNGSKNYYFEQYFDLTNIYLRSADGGKETRIANASGLYVIEVNYQVQKITQTLVGSEWVYSTGATETRTTMKYALYLLDESEYSNYPAFKTDTITKGNNSDNGTIQYFYNFDKSDYPTYSYDASKYNVKFSRQLDKQTYSYESTFTLSDDLSYGTLVFTNINDSSDSFTQRIEKTSTGYPVTLNFTGQGVYTITNRYIVNVNNEYHICNNLVAESYLYPRLDTEGDMYRSQYILHIFGFTAHFNSSTNYNEMLMLNNGNVSTSDMLIINTPLTKTINSDITYLFTKSELQNYNSNEKLLTSVASKLGADFNNFLFVSTDQPPIAFSYIGEYKYSGIVSQSKYYRYNDSTSTSKSEYYLRKDAHIEDPGYYEVIINYTYSEYSVDSNIGSQVTHTQAFIFTISNTSPKISIENEDGSIVNEDENNYTNQNVIFKVNPDTTTSLNDNYFNAPITIQMTKRNYANTSSTTSIYQSGTYITENAKYTMVVSYGVNGISKDSYQFVIDKMPISNVKSQAVDAITELNSDTILYYQFINSANLNEYYNNSKLFNQPFTLIFDEKASGATIDVTYKRYYFQKNLTAGSIVNGKDGSTFITTNYELNLSSTPQSSVYSYDRSMFDQRLAHVDSVFDLDTSCLILFYLKDSAGNEYRYYVIYDLTTPYVNITPEIQNSYNIVSEDATVTWGDYKAIKITGGDFNNNISNNSTEKFNQYISTTDTLITDLYKEGTENGTDYTYLTIPINQIYVNYLTSDNVPLKNYYVKDYDPYDSSKYQLHLIDSIAGSNDYSVFPFVSSITLSKGENGEVTSFKNGLYVGENDISYNVSDKSNISGSTSSIKNDNSFDSNIWLNLDKSLGLAFVKVPGYTTSYGTMISEKTPITANQLRFSYIPGEDDFAVSSLTYDFYEIDANSYTSYVEVSYDNGEPTPYFPYKVTPTLANQTFSIDSTIKKSDDQERKFSDIINQETINGTTYTKSGMYVFKRVYAGDVSDDKIRYYVYYVDRTGIIEIDAELLNDDRIVYEQGYGFVFNFSSDGTKFTALQIQQYLASAQNPTETNLFTSNKLPINFEIPFDKFNSRRLLTNSSTASAYRTNSSYISTVKAFNEYCFKINTSIEVVSVDSNNNVTKKTYSTLEYLVSDLYTANCINPGTYTVTITDNSGYTSTEGEKNYNCNKYSFRFEITHSAPEATYHTKDLSLAVNTKESSNNGVNYQEYVSTNSKLLQLSFDNNTNPYKATVNASTFTIYKDSSVAFSMTNNVARLNGQVIYTLTNNVPMLNGELETKYSTLFTDSNGEIQNGQTFEVKNVNNVATAYLNGNLVYRYVEGVFKDADNNPENKFSSVFRDTICKFVIENGTGTYYDASGNSTLIFELQDRIPMMGNKIASEYSNIFVYDEATNKYIITIFNAEDSTHKYIADYLTEATYKVVLSYEGNQSDYAYTYKTDSGIENSVNFYQKTFSITVDRTAPEYNLNQLISNDKFYSNKKDIDTTDYFFAVDPTFVFVKQNELETNEMFYRYLGPQGNVTSTYEYTIVPDNPAYNTGELSNHNRFIETAMSNGEYVYKNMYYGRITESFGYNYGYYEIIERDEALNYRVYAIYYNDPNTEISFTYDQAESNGIQDTADETLTSTSNPFTVKGIIKDNKGNPIEGITVKVKNTDTSVTTDTSGEFLISDLLGIQTLEFVSTDYSFIPATKRVNELNYNYDETSMDQETLNSHYISVVAYQKLKGTLSETNTTLVAEGQNLKFNLSNISTDYYMRAIITGSNGYKTEVINKPSLTDIPAEPLEGMDAWEDFVEKINSAISAFSTENSYGYTFNIEFINRYGDNFHLKYVLPGIMLTPSIVETQANTKFTFTIPSDPSGTTYIRRLEVRKFSGTGNWTIIARDSTNKTISTYNDGNPLEITTYTFTQGEYMFTVTDNFNRVSVHYKGVGVNDVRSMDYGTSTTIGGITYTAGSVTLSYQTALYQLKVIEINADGTRTDITNALKVNNVSEISNINNVRKLEFQNNEVEGQIVNGVTMDGIRQFEVQLYVEKLDLTYTYKFIINRTNPKIDLKNLSGEKLKETSTIAGNPTIHTEDFTVSWEASDPLLFNPKVKLTRTYFEDNQEKTEIISSITNGYRITKTGTYKAEIYNSLGFSDSNKTIYFKRIDGNIVMYSIIKTTNSQEIELEVSSDMPNIYIGSSSGTAAPLYKYYALKYETVDKNDITTTTYDAVEIRVNPSKGLIYRHITEDDEIYTREGILIRAEDNVYRIYGAEGDDGTVSYGYDQYIQIVYILSTSDFVKANISTESHDYVTPSTTIGSALRDNIKNTSDYIDITFPAFNSEKGNPIYLSYSFNGIYVETISNPNGSSNTLRLSNAGVYSLTFYDLAGNVQKYSFTTNRSDSFTISLINNVLYTVNDKTPIQNEIFNSTVILEVINKQLYDGETVIVSATKDGKEIKLVNSATSYNSYVFEGQGHYTVTLTADVTGDISGLERTSIVTEYNFTIVNPNQAQRSFNIPLNQDFTITKVLRENVNITYTFDNNKELWLSSGDEKSGSGIYTITVNAYVPQTKSYRAFSFKVWINDEVPVIISSLDFGKETTKQITLSFNKNLIYQQIGESIIHITGMDDIVINETTSTENIRESITLVQNRTYTIQVLTSDGKVISSYKLTKNEPLNTVSIIVIVIVSIVVIGLIITFIVLRKHIKYR